LGGGFGPRPIFKGDLVEGYIIYILLAYIIYRDVVYDHRLNKLLNRVMSKNYQEFEYYDKKYPGDLKEVDALRNEARDERKIDVPEDKEDIETREILEAFDEDWAPSEVDKTKVADLLK